MQPKILYRAIVSALSLVALNIQAHDDHDHNNASLSTIEVSSQIQSQDTFSRELNTDYLSRSVAQSLDDMFKLEPSIDAGTGARNGQKLFMRGVEDLNLNVQIDGARQGQNLFHHQGRMQIDPFLIKKVDVKPGPAAADAGPGALGGSVVFETVDAQDLLKPGKSVGARIGFQHETANELNGGLVSTYGKLGEYTGLLAYVRRNTNQELRAGGGEKLPSTDGAHENYLLKLSVLDLDGHSLRLSTQRSQDEGGALRANWPWQTNGLVQAADDQQIYDESQNLRYGYRPQDQDMIDLKFDFYNALTGLKRNLATITTDWATLSYGGDLNNTSRFSSGHIRHALTYGVDYFHDKGRDVTTNKPTLSESGENTGVYIQNRMEVGSVRVSAGLRQDNYQASYNNRHNTSGSVISPNISGEWDLIKTDTLLTLFAGYGQSVRGGRLNQAGWINKYPENQTPPSATVFELGDNGKLKPEIAYQTEWGARWHDLNVFSANDHAGLDITFYDLRIQDYLITNGEGLGALTDKIYNAKQDVTSQGYEIRAHWGVQNLLSSLSFSHNRFRDYNGLPGDTSGSSARVGSSVGDKLVWDVSWQWQPNLSLAYTLTAVDKLQDVPPTRPQKPGYSVHDMQLQWQPLIAKDALHLTFAIENILDTRYAQHTAVRTFYNGEQVANWEAGRNLKIALDWFF